jgi:sulfur relay (sulfurtransferase) complex TusBCD TusD component (DsrE family)
MAINLLNVAIADKRAAHTREYQNTATSFLKSSSEVSDTWVSIFLLYHAIECGLKAYLTSKDALGEKLKRSHDITELAQEASAHGLVLTTCENRSLGTFTALSQDGVTENRPSLALRYYTGGGATSESPSVLKPIAESILNQITQ